MMVVITTGELSLIRSVMHVLQEDGYTPILADSSSMEKQHHLRTDSLLKRADKDIPVLDPLGLIRYARKCLAEADQLLIIPVWAMV